jgi:hypothetical protein
MKVEWNDIKSKLETKMNITRRNVSQIEKVTCEKSNY